MTNRKDSWMDREWDDTKSAYYDCWREGAEHPMPSLVPAKFNTVTIDNDRMPDLKTWGWRVWFQHFCGFDKEADNKYSMWRIGDMGGVSSWGADRLWLWDHNGAGDYVRISTSRSLDGGDRWMVCFNHESDRSPYAVGRGEDNNIDTNALAEGLDWLSPYYLSEMRDAGQPHGSSMSEVYRWIPERNLDQILGLEPATFKGRWITSDTIEAIHDQWNKPYDPADHLIESMFKDDGWLEDEGGRSRHIEVMAQYRQLWDQIQNGEYPSLLDLHDLIGHDQLTAITFTKMRDVRLWYSESNGEYRKITEE